MKKIFILIISIISFIPSLAYSEIIQDEMGWYCGKKQDWTSIQITIDKIYLHGFFFNKTNAFLTDLKKIKVQYILSNRSKKDYILNVQVIGLDKQGRVTFAMTASPLFDIIESQSNEAISSEVATKNYAFEKSDKFCISIVGEYS